MILWQDVKFNYNGDYMLVRAVQVFYTRGTVGYTIKWVAISLYIYRIVQKFDGENFWQI